MQTNTTTTTIITTVALRMAEGMQTVPALRVEGGLALHKDPARPTFWTISHVLSGLSVWHKCARGKADAMVRFDAILSLTDWNRPKEDLLNEPDLYNRIRDLRENPPSAPRPEKKSRPPLRVAKRVNGRGEEFEAPVWWEDGGLTVEGDPAKGLIIGHEATGLRLAALPRRISRAKAVRLAKAFLALGGKYGMDWTKRNPFPPEGVPQELRDLVQAAEQGIF